MKKANACTAYTHINTDSLCRYTLVRAKLANAENDFLLFVNCDVSPQMNAAVILLLLFLLLLQSYCSHMVDVGRESTHRRNNKTIRIYSHLSIFSRSFFAFEFFCNFGFVVAVEREKEMFQCTRSLATMKKNPEFCWFCTEIYSRMLLIQFVCIFCAFTRSLALSQQCIGKTIFLSFYATFFWLQAYLYTLAHSFHSV